MALRRRSKSIEGFTLAELLAAVAIVAILTITAASSLVLVSKNMLLSELDSAAAALAQSVQNEMTSLKVSGVWADTISEVATNQAKGLADGEEREDIYYLTAVQAKALGIVTGLSIESSVGDGDFIIEYSRSTATVHGVFFADGRTSLFSEESSSSDAAAAYYDLMQSAGGRDKTARGNADPMVGYYQAMLPTASDTVALENPVIWIDELNGNLCVQNPNLANPGGAFWATSSILKVTVSKDNGAAEALSFSLSGLGRSLGQYRIEATDLAPFDRTNDTELSLISRTGGAQSDTFNIALPQILTAMGAVSNEYKTLADLFNKGERTRVDAEVTAPAGSPASMAARATAFFASTKGTAKLTVLVTNPDYREAGVQRASHINQNISAYLNPKVSITTKNGGYTTKKINEAAPKVFGLVGTDPVLSLENPQAAYQAYTGGYVDTSEIDRTMLIEAQVPAYAATSTETRSLYSTCEIWVAGETNTRIGYVKNHTFIDGAQDSWVWQYPGFSEKITGYSKTVNDEKLAVPLMAAGVICIDPDGFSDLCSSVGLAPDASGGYTVYIRATPRVSLVEDFYRNIATPALAGPAAGQTASVREISSAGAAIRRQIEAKFGAASSVALLTISRQAGGTNGENSGIKGFPTNTSAFRIYYSYTPALGFAGNFDQATLKQEVYRPHNTALFYRASAKFWPPAMAQPHREGEWPEDIYLTLNNTTFALPYQQDPLFYRALFYYDEDRTTLLASTFDLPNPQFMPYTRQNTAAIQQFGTRKVWYTENVYKTPGLSYSVVAGQTMNSYHDSLAMGRVNLSFAGIGMMYIEFNGDVPTAYYGYPDGHAARPVSTLRADNVKTNWGYYAVVPYGSPAPSVEFGVSPMVQVRVGATPTALTVDGVTYHAYRINSNHSKADSVLMVDTNHTNLITPQTLRCSVGGLYKSYYCNILFAGAVARNQADTTTWGTTASPYQVRHADQMWGYLPRVHYGIEETLEEWYDDKNYIQTHSFDMRGYQNLDNQKLHPFTDDWLKATYDGGGYEISGYTPTVSVSNSNATTIGMFGGLFWRVGNGGVVKNVHMTDVQSANITTGAGYTHTPYTCIGILAGHVQGDLCSIENCSVEGAEGSVVSVTLGGNTTFETGIGGLIGYIQDGNDVINCSVKNIDLRVNTGTTSPTRAVIDAGGLIGRAWNVVNVKGSSVTNTKLSVTIGDKSTSTCDYLEVGGLIGRLAASSSADGCTVSHSSCTIKGASWTGVIAPGNDVYRLRCGALLGQNNYSNLKNSTVDTFDCTVTAPLGRIASAYAGFGAFAGYSEAPIGNVYDNNHASDIRFDLNWSGSALSAPNATWVGGMIGWAYSTDYTGTINSSNSFSNVKRIVRNASGTSSTENVTSKVGKHMIP